MAKAKSPEAKSPSFEAQLARLQVITQTLEKGELSLEESIGLYKEGVALAATCRKTLDEARHTVKIYTEEGLKDFVAENKETQ